jgi:alkaline phosphatase
LQVEGGRVDQGCHNCDAAAALRDQIAFDEAIDVCLDFQRRQPDTLIVITTDHGNGNLGLNGIGSGYGRSSFLFDNVMNVKKSFAELIKLLRETKRYKPEEYEARFELARTTNPFAHPASGGTPEAERIKADEKGEEEKKPETPPRDKELITVKSPKDLVEIIQTHTGYKLTPRRAELLSPYLAKKGAPLFELMNSDMAALGQVMGNYLGIGWTGNAHTADYVLLTALGPGAELFRGYLQNTDVFYHYLALADIQHRNPTEPLCADAGPSAQEAERVEEYALA